MKKFIALLLKSKESGDTTQNFRWPLNPAIISDENAHLDKSIKMNKNFKILHLRNIVSTLKEIISNTRNKFYNPLIRSNINKQTLFIKNRMQKTIQLG